METVNKDKNKGGRPVKPVKKEKIITLRMDKTEHFIIGQKARKAGLTWSQYVREVAINGQVRARLTEEQMDIARKLIGMSTNLNQLTKGFHEEGLMKTAQSLKYYRNKIDDIIQLLRA